jgi:Protein of unknown function (DUF1997)
MSLQFNACQSVTIPICDRPWLIQHYLKQPQRLIEALVEPKRIQALGQGRFRLKMRSFAFMTVHIQPVVDLLVWHEAEANQLCLKSVACQISGNDYINQRFQLQLNGALTAVAGSRGTQLDGLANLSVKVDLPPAFWITPRPLLEASGNSLLKGILLTMKQRLSKQLLADYASWAQAQPGQGSLSDRALPSASLPL